MKLLELYEEIFQYMCRLNRMAKTTAHLEYARVRSEVKDLLEGPSRNASADVRLANQVKRLELPLLFFVDNLICTSRLQFAQQWADKRLAAERNELAGDERFFDLLEDDLKDPGEDAAERLGVFYVCLGLGFTGMYVTQPEKIRIYMDQMFPRVRQWIDSDPRTKISEEAYRHTDTRSLTEPPSSRIALVAVIFIFVSLCVLVAYYALYAKAVGEVTNSVHQIENNSKGLPAPDAN